MGKVRRRGERGLLHAHAPADVRIGKDALDAAREKIAINGADKPGGALWEAQTLPGALGALQPGEGVQR